MKFRIVGKMKIEKQTSRRLNWLAKKIPYQGVIGEAKTNTMNNTKY